MKLIKNKYKIRCELGACRNFAEYTLQVERSGIHSSINVCGECALKIKNAITQTLSEQAQTIQPENSAKKEKNSTAHKAKTAEGVL